MPLARYFLYVGGVLLALLVVASAWLPKPPAVAESAEYLPPIRIHSDRKWPERIVFDTSAPRIEMAQAAEPVVNPPAPPPPARVIPPDLRDVLAQLQPPEAGQSQRHDPPSRASKPAPRRRIARKPAAPPVQLVVERRSPFGGFGPTIW
jgi:hypothetical protein